MLNKNTSQYMRSNPLFMRNQYPVCGCWDIPMIRKQKVDLTDICLIACSDTRPNDNDTNKKCGVHFLWMIIGLKMFIEIQRNLCVSLLNMLFC